MNKALGWKLATVLLGLTSAFLAYDKWSATKSPPPATSTPLRSHSLPPSLQNALRSIRANPNAFGLSESQTLTELAKQTNPKKLVVLINRLR